MIGSALISLFFGAWVASRLAQARFSSDGLWHGLTAWAFALVAALLLGALGVSGLLGFAGNAATALRDIIPQGVAVLPEDIQTAAGLATTTLGYFLIGALGSLATALLGGWLGSSRLRMAEPRAEREVVQERRVA